MPICTFLATKEIENAAELRAKLYDITVNLIDEKGVKNFFAGSGSVFDAVVYEVLDKIGKYYEGVLCCAILPDENIPDSLSCKPYIEWACPTDIEKAPAKFAYKVRDRWLKDTADIVVLYGKKPKGLKGKRIIAV